VCNTLATLQDGHFIGLLKAFLARRPVPESTAALLHFFGALTTSQAAAAAFMDRPSAAKDLLEHPVCRVPSPALEGAHCLVANLLAVPAIASTVQPTFAEYLTNMVLHGPVEKSSSFFQSRLAVPRTNVDRENMPTHVTHLFRALSNLHKADRTLGRLFMRLRVVEHILERAASCEPNYAWYRAALWFVGQACWLDADMRRSLKLQGPRVSTALAAARSKWDGDIDLGGVARVVEFLFSRGD